MAHVPSSGTLAPPRRHAPRLAVDERLVMPETRYEAIDGRIRYVCPSDEPHGTVHSKLAALLEAYVAPAYRVAVDMLTRTSEKDDMAPDASVFPGARNPATGGRKLEELAFEVVSTEALSHAGKKARALTGRGVRRVFAIDVERRRALEWSRKTAAWEILPPDGVLSDHALALPLPWRALAEAAQADDAVARALLAKKNPVLEEALREARGKGKDEGRIEGKIEGKIEALLVLLAARGLRITKKAAHRIRSERDEAVVDWWLRLAPTCASVDALSTKG